jgi:excisionase family DNA binding protein
MAKVSEKPKVKSQELEGTVLTLEEAAYYLKIPKSVLEKQLASGNIPGKNIGGHPRFLKSALDQWLATKDFSKEQLLTLAGAFAHDESFPDLLEAIKANRKRADAMRS